MVELLEDKGPEIAELCDRYRVRRLHVFGSALRDDYRTGASDLDLLVEFETMDPPDLADAYFGLLDELRKTLGVEIDLVMADAVKNRFVAEDIERTKQVLYAA